MERNEKLARRWFREVWCEPRRVETIDELLADDAKLHGVNPTGPLSKGDFKRIHAFFIEKYPDIRIDVVKTVVTEDAVALHARVTGTHAESGRSVQFAGTAIAEFEEGRMTEVFETWDFASMLAQNGTLEERIVLQELTPA